MLGLCKAVKRQARTTLMSGNIHENCKVGKTSYRPMDLCSSKITETKRESGGTQRNLRFSQLSLGGVAKAHAESCIFFWCWVMCQIFVLSWGLPPVKYLPFLVMLKGAGLSRKHQTHRVTARTLQVGSTGHSLTGATGRHGVLYYSFSICSTERVSRPDRKPLAAPGEAAGTVSGCSHCARLQEGRRPLGCDSPTPFLMQPSI